MTFLGVLLLMIPGFLAVKYFFRDAALGLLEKTGLVLFLSLVLVPFVNINCAFLNGRYVGSGLTIITSVFLSVILAALIFFGRETGGRQKNVCPAVSKNEWFLLIVTGLVCLFAGAYYTNKEFILSLGSYFIKGDAECFYQQSFRVIRELNPDFKSGIPAGKVYEIICTPGNILFTATNIFFFKLFSFKITYILFTCLLFIFVYLVVNKLLERKIIALCTGLFAVFNPYILSVEVLDRNIIALTVSAILIYLVLEHKNKVFLHGLVFGILSGTGLRFLPLLFIVPVVMFYYQGRKDVKAYLVFLAGFTITFTFNLPHLFFNGLNSMGETEPSLTLIREMFTGRLRTPFLPFPNAVFYMMNILKYFGYLFSGIILLGAISLYKINRKLFIIFLFIFLPLICVLSYQKNWIESDKCRIILTGFLPLYVFFAYGLKRIFLKESISRKSTAVLVSVVLPAAFVWIFTAVDFAQDTGFYGKKYLYQQESLPYHGFVKKALSRAGFFPDYKRLMVKNDLKRKSAEEELILARLFPEGGLPAYDKFEDFYSGWREYFAPKPGTGEHDKSTQDSFVYIEIDFDKLVTDLANAVRRIGYSDLCAVDLSKKEGLFDVYYADLNISWQKQPLTATVILRSDEIKDLKELNIDLNAFAGFAKDTAGFDVINSINLKSRPALRKTAIESAMGTFPLVSENNKMIFCVPGDFKIIIRNWFVNETGSPYKVDGWRVLAGKNGAYNAEFFYNEPESYL